MNSFTPGKIFTTAIIMAIVVSAVISCRKDKAGYGSISVRLTDAPASLQQVNVDIQKVQVHLVPDAGKSDWIDLPTQSGIYDLLKLQNGIDTPLVDYGQLTAGKITQMRLILGTHNTVMADSTLYNLTVPSGTETGIKLVGQLKVDPNQQLKVLLDFDAQQSVVEHDSTTYHLKPVIKVMP